MLNSLQEPLLKSQFDQVDAVYDGKFAVESVLSQPIHAYSMIILDINMPFMDGLEVCRRAKAIERLAGVPIIIMTSLTDEKTKGKVRDAGADLLIHKPIAGRTLQGHIHDLLAARTG